MSYSMYTNLALLSHKMEIINVMPSQCWRQRRRLLAHREGDTLLDHLCVLGFWRREGGKRQLIFILIFPCCVKIMPDWCTTIIIIIIANFNLQQYLYTSSYLTSYVCVQYCMIIKTLIHGGNRRQPGPMQEQRHQSPLVAKGTYTLLFCYTYACQQVTNFLVRDNSSREVQQSYGGVPQFSTCLFGYLEQGTAQWSDVHVKYE